MVVRTESLRIPNWHDTGSTSPRSVGEVALIGDTISHYSRVSIAPLAIISSRRHVQKKIERRAVTMRAADRGRAGGCGRDRQEKCGVADREQKPAEAVHQRRSWRKHISGRLREFCRTLPNQREITVKGLHHLQEDWPNEIGAAIRDFVV